MDRNKAEEVVISVIEKHVPGLQLTPDDLSKNLTDLGVDSLETMIVIMDISEASSKEIDDDQADSLDTPQKIIDLISQ